MIRWVIAGIVIVLVLLMIAPIIMALGERLRNYFKQLNGFVAEKRNSTKAKAKKK